MADGTHRTLRLATFLVPSISVEFFEALVLYLEKKMKCQATLLYESRFEGPQSAREDLFSGPHAVDLGTLAPTFAEQLLHAFA